jgi:hypothetical protein
MANDWTTYRVLCTAPPDLEPERIAFYEENAKFAERITMPRRILFALASPRSDFNPQIHARPVESNIQFCDFFVQICGEDVLDPAYRRFVELAVECTGDQKFPMRAAAVLFRNPGEASEETQRFRERLLNHPDCTVHDFRGPEELGRASEAILASWCSLIENPG